MPIKSGGVFRSPGSTRPRYLPALEPLEDRCLLAGGFVLANLLSDLPGLARNTDSQLINPWGLSLGPTGAFWLSNEATGVSTLADGTGRPDGLVVSVPGGPTGAVFNTTDDFTIRQGGRFGASLFLFATEQGTIAGWNPTVDLTHALTMVGPSAGGGRFTGLALAVAPSGPWLYAADFRSGALEVFDGGFRRVSLPGAFSDPTLPADFAPFNVAVFGQTVVVTYARHDASGNVLTGAGSGFLDAFDLDGQFRMRFAAGGALDAPWGVALAPEDFGAFAGDLLVGNFGDGRVNAFDRRSGRFLGTLTDDSGTAISLPGLWALTFGNGAGGSFSDSLYFTAASASERHGLFGRIQAASVSPLAPDDLVSPEKYDLQAAEEGKDEYPLPPSTSPDLTGDIASQPVVVAVPVPIGELQAAVAPMLVTAVPVRAPEGAGQMLVSLAAGSEMPAGPAIGPRLSQAHSPGIEAAASEAPSAAIDVVLDLATRLRPLPDHSMAGRDGIAGGRSSHPSRMELPDFNTYLSLAEPREPGQGSDVVPSTATESLLQVQASETISPTPTGKPTSWLRGLIPPAMTFLFWSSAGLLWHRRSTAHTTQALSLGCDRQMKSWPSRRIGPRNHCEQRPKRPGTVVVPGPRGRLPA